MTFLRIKRRQPTNRDVNPQRYNITFQNGRHVVRLWLQPIGAYKTRTEAEAHLSDLIKAA